MRTGKWLEHSATRLSRSIHAGVFFTCVSAIAISVFASGPLPGWDSGNSPVGKSGAGNAIAVSQPTLSLSQASQSIPVAVVYSSDCVTPKTTFNLGETVCAKVTALTGLRLQWLDPDGFAVSTTNIASDPATDFLVLPSTDQSSIGGLFVANNLGRWRVNAITSRSSVKTSAFFTVKDPVNPKVDLSVVNSLVGVAVPNPGDSVQFAVTIANQGPNDAPNTHLAANIFTNAIFNSLTQTSGPLFTCTGGDCNIASFPNGASAAFVVNLTAGTGGGVLECTAIVSSETSDLNPVDNSSTAAPIEVAATGPAPSCALQVTAPPSVTLYTGAGATSCGVAVNNLDQTLGTASVIHDCPLVGDITRTGVPPGNDFPVGSTTITYSAVDELENTASAIQNVMVVDNTPPVITCPGNLTLMPTCPAGAVASWVPPAVSDNCPGPTAVQTAGPPNGSLFPTGTTLVAYAVSDAAGNQTSCTFSVEVLTPSAALKSLEAAVDSSSLTGPQKQGLLPKLDAALAAIDRGTSTAACKILSAFISTVENHVAHGDVSGAVGQSWISSANNIGNAIGCTGHPCS